MSAVIRRAEIVYICIAVHLTFAAICVVDPTVVRITALYSMHLLFGEMIAFVLVAASVLAAMPLFMSFRPLNAHFFLWPQQLILFLGAVAAVMSSVSGIYPDGYQASSRAFIAADQCILIYLTIAHLVVVIRNARIR